ncbi:MAG: hypothetical protein J6U54_03615 [Clostridiales bacterium]|nr:hypothetical protein [Clostridiales bacterium]
MKIYMVCNNYWGGEMIDEVFESKEDAKARCYELANKLKNEEWARHGYDWSKDGLTKDSIKIREDEKGMVWIELWRHFSQVFRVQELKVKGKLA